MFQHDRHSRAGIGVNALNKCERSECSQDPVTYKVVRSRGGCIYKVHHGPSSQPLSTKFSETPPPQRLGHNYVSRRNLPI